MVRTFLVTANVGSVFESEEGLPIWLNEFASVVRSKDPEFVAIHFQETGGKSCEDAYDLIETFFRRLVDRMEQLHFQVAEGYVDSRCDVEDQFTALSSIYFVHESLRLPVYIWDFQDAKFHEVSFRSSSALAPHPNVHIGPSLDQTHRKQKEKFPKHFYPNCKWSRKGFLRTRWRFGKTIVDLVNIHLFHDSCNLLAASAFPSPFAQLREKTLKYTLDRIQSDDLEKSSLFIFGDFNFRVDSKGIMEILRKDFGTDSGLILETKRFQCPEQELRFKQSYEWLKQYDFETKQFRRLLQEQDLNFHPTYPFEENINEPEEFMKTRMPSWCDRVLFTPPTKDIFAKDFPTEYGVIGSKVCMGDHKPVGLSLKIRTDDQPPPTVNCKKGAGTAPIIKGNLLFVTMPKNEIIVELSKAPAMTFVSSANANIQTAQDFHENAFSTPCWHTGNNNYVTKTCISNSGAGGNSPDLSLLDEHITAPVSESSRRDCKCFFGLFRFRGKKRLPRGNTKVNGGGGGNHRKALSSFRALSQCKNGTNSRSGSLLEPIATAACDSSFSSQSSSATSSQRPSIRSSYSSSSSERAPSVERGADDEFGNTSKCILNADNFTNLSTAPPAIKNSSNEVFRNDVYWRCANCCEVTRGQESSISAQLPQVVAEMSRNNKMNGATAVITCNGLNCPNRLIMMNLTSMITTAATTNIKDHGEIPLSTNSNLSLIAINRSNDSDKQAFDKIVINDGCTDVNNGKIPIVWDAISKCPDCDILNSRNLMMQSVDKSGKRNGNANGAHFRNRSESQSSASGFHRCKCHIKDGMSRSSATGSCLSCSKCAIL